MGTLRFILGRAGSGKTTTIVNEISELLRDDPLGNPILLLVPDQATLLYERLLACAPGSAGYLRLRVTTFRHLVERLLCEGGGSSIPEVTPIGRRILIGRLLRRLQPQLSFYKSTARQPGLAAKLDEAFAEIERSGRNLDDLPFIASDIEAQDPQSSLPAKLRDLHVLIREYDSILGKERLDQHRRFAHALSAAGRSSTLPETRLYVDDFYDFNSTERALLVQIARHALQATVALAVDPARVASLIGNQPIEDDQLLRGSSMAFRRLHRLAEESKIAVEQISLKSSPRFESTDLLHIDRQFEATRPGRVSGNGSVQFVEAATRLDEVDAAARQIQSWTRQGLRLRDILVVARDIGEYEREVDSSFREHGIPFFIDRQRPASHHPLIRSVRALLQLPLTDFRHDVVIDLIKSSLCGIHSEAADALENYLLAHRVRGAATWATDWLYAFRKREDDEAAKLRREQLAAINKSRQWVYFGVEPLLKDDRPLPASEWCASYCQAMDRLQLPKALATQIAARHQAGELEWAASDQAVWTEFTELLDQLCSVLGDEPLTLREYAEVVDVALERFTLAIAPPTVDQVLVGSVDRTRSANVKACIVLGLSEGNFPRRSEEVAALSDEDRQQLDVRHFELASDTRRKLMDEQTLAYLAFTRPSQRLTLIRNLVDSDGRPLGPSIFWTQLLRLFKDPSVAAPAVESSIESIATATQLANSIVRWAAREQADPPPDELALTRWLMTTDDLRIAPIHAAITAAMKYRNDAALSPALAAELFSQPFALSATRLETFAACPFKHFAQYTLALRPRDAADLTRLDLGTVYHQVLEQLIGEAIRSKTDLAKPIPDLPEKIRRHSETAAAELRSEFMLTPGRNQYLLESVRSTVEHIAETQRHTIASGAFRPRLTEFAFGFSGRAPALQLTTTKGRSVELRGKIDRIDVWPMGDQVAASVVDYKLTEHRPNFAMIRRGLNLQLLTYLLVLDAMGERLIGAPVQPAAAFYVRLLRQIESIDHPDECPEPAEPRTYLKNYRPRGVVDERFLEAIDFQKSLALKPIAKPGAHRNGDLLRTESFEALLSWTRGKLADLADQIMDGAAPVTPYKLRTQTPCSTCNYRSVCRLDLAFNRYLPVTLTSDEALGAIVKEAT